MDNMFEELGYGLAEVVWNERDKHLNKNLWDMLDYETAVMCLENQLIDYWTFRYGTGDEYYDDTMTTAEAFIDRMKELAQGTEYDIIEIPNEIKQVKRATPSI